MTQVCGASHGPRRHGGVQTEEPRWSTAWRPMREDLHVDQVCPEGLGQLGHLFAPICDATRRRLLPSPRPVEPLALQALELVEADTLQDTAYASRRRRVVRKPEPVSDAAQSLHRS